EEGHLEGETRKAMLMTERRDSCQMPKKLKTAQKHGTTRRSVPSSSSINSNPGGGNSWRLSIPSKTGHTKHTRRCAHLQSWN
ncbi:hypothetical protein E2562_014149, partial [Oryza meyeriana var. granulata]